MATLIRFEPGDVSVSDDRGTVQGAAVVITLDDGDEIRDEIIPPEGDGPDCWLGPVLARHPEWYDALENAAKRGAAGERGSITTETQGDRHEGS